MTKEKATKILAIALKKKKPQRLFKPKYPEFGECPYCGSIVPYCSNYCKYCGRQMDLITMIDEENE